MLYGALEAGGTKMICGICKENGEIVEQTSIPTKTPDETIPKIIDFFRGKDIVALGIACFGPIDLHPSSETYGYITSTPKIAWQNYPIVPVIQKALSIPIGFDTDVNGSLLGEVSYGSSRGIENAVYITIGTGIGGGVLSNGKLLHGMLHPELGHMALVPHEKDHFGGNCPFHKNCFEGMASGPAMEARYGKKADKLSDVPLVLGDGSLLYRAGTLQYHPDSESGEDYPRRRCDASGAALPSHSSRGKETAESLFKNKRIGRFRPLHHSGKPQ